MENLTIIIIFFNIYKDYYYLLKYYFNIVGTGTFQELTAYSAFCLVLSLWSDSGRVFPSVYIHFFVLKFELHLNKVKTR